MTPARRRHPALAAKIDMLSTDETRANRKALSYLVQEIHECAEARGHNYLMLDNTFFSDTHARVTCLTCSKDADAQLNPPANGIAIGGELIALGCKDFLDEHVEVIEVKL